jgi:hypothetical protein
VMKRTTTVGTASKTERLEDNAPGHKDRGEVQVALAFGGKPGTGAPSSITPQGHCQAFHTNYGTPSKVNEMLFLLFRSVKYSDGTQYPTPFFDTI